MPAAYEVILDDIITRIRAGMLKPGDRLPTIEAMAAQYKTSQTTVKDAMRILRRIGWLRGQQGKAIYVADTPPT